MTSESLSDAPDVYMCLLVECTRARVDAPGARERQRLILQGPGLLLASTSVHGQYVLAIVSQE